MVRSIRLQNVTKKKNGVTILDNVSFTIPGSLFFALLGPSGCGKTTLLRLITGLEQVDSGKIFLGNKEITNIPVHKRPINMVFQNYALFPHLSIFDNIGYALSIKKIPKTIIKEKVLKLANAFHLNSHLHKKPSQLSGGQQQRVSIARAIIEGPEVLLLDEPLAALDFKLREKLLIELIELQDELEITFVYVTHDQEEALTVADKMAIMNPEGEIEQMGTPKEIYEFPVSRFVAEFVGSTNIFSGTVDKKDNEPLNLSTHLGKFSLDQKKVGSWAKDGSRALLTIRPEKILITKRSSPEFSNFLKGIVHSIVYTGRSTYYEVLVGDTKVKVFEQNDEHVEKEMIDYDDEVFLYWQKENTLALEGV
ncbi:MAG: Spermidine/putrescine import ATP-binding protein PotA [Chlamydiia bacterium]|nr:Spermidine/putrescine import ATP-binding protein PotA [Chlamydiia bacterium]